MRKTLGRFILASMLALSTLTSTAAVASAAPQAGQAVAADVNSCANNASDATCTGAPVDASPVGSDPCFADSYSLTYEYGYKDASFKYSDLGWTFETWLDYSPLCKSNFTYTQVIVTGPLPYYVSNKVRRAPDRMAPT